MDSTHTYTHTAGGGVLRCLPGCQWNQERGPCSTAPSPDAVCSGLQGWLYSQLSVQKVGGWWTWRRNHNYKHACAKERHRALKGTEDQHGSHSWSQGRKEGIWRGINTVAGRACLRLLFCIGCILRHLLRLQPCLRIPGNIAHHHSRKSALCVYNLEGFGISPRLAIF